MNDQLALGVLWREAAGRAQRQNRGTELGEAPARVAAGIAADVDLFGGLMDRLGIRRARQAGDGAPGRAAWPPPLNGQARGDSPLSRFVELDFLPMGIEGRKPLWTTLRDLAGLGKLVPGVDFDRLIGRAEEQRATIESFRADAGREALPGRPGLSGG